MSATSATGEADSFLPPFSARLEGSVGISCTLDNLVQSTNSVLADTQSLGRSVIEVMGEAGLVTGESKDDPEDARDMPRSKDEALVVSDAVGLLCAGLETEGGWGVPCVVVPVAATCSQRGAVQQKSASRRHVIAYLEIGKR